MARLRFNDAAICRFTRIMPNLAIFRIWADPWPTSTILQHQSPPQKASLQHSAGARWGLRRLACEGRHGQYSGRSFDPHDTNCFAYGARPVEESWLEWHRRTWRTAWAALQAAWGVDPVTAVVRCAGNAAARLAARPACWVVGRAMRWFSAPNVAAMLVARWLGLAFLGQLSRPYAQVMPPSALAGWRSCRAQMIVVWTCAERALVGSHSGLRELDLPDSLQEMCQDETCLAPS